MTPLKQQSFRTRIMLSFLVVIIILCAVFSAFILYLINSNIVARAVEQKKNALNSARTIYDSEIENIGNFLELFFQDNSLSGRRQLLMSRARFDYVFEVPTSRAADHKDEIVRTVMRTGKSASGTRIVKEAEIRELGPELFREKIFLQVVDTLQARVSDIKELRDGMAMEYAMPVRNEKNEIIKIAAGGRFINRYFSLVDRIHGLLFENRHYRGKPIGTVTFFQGDTRITTNVLDREKKRAIGTRVSSAVYDKVLLKGETFFERAFVVTDWYLTGYEPIRSVSGDIIGMLYVGLLEAPFLQLKRTLYMIISLLIVSAVFISSLISVGLSGAISRPITALLKATGHIAKGEFDYRIETVIGSQEIFSLLNAFNSMAFKIKQRDTTLNMANRELTGLNKSYLDLISFVSHELKNILASTTLNAYMVRDGFLGMINFKQRRALDSVVKNIDYLTETVKTFLSLSRIEKGEMACSKIPVKLNEDIFCNAVEPHIRSAADKNIEIQNRIPENLVIQADQDLLKITAGNLVSNAIKYGISGGKIIISSQISGKFMEIDVYNDGMPLSAEDIDQLFKKFSRLKRREYKNIQGTGLGLYITKNIIEMHGGEIKILSRPNGNSFIFTLPGNHHVNNNTRNDENTYSATNK
ncbi:MAG: hypothetical protein A2096_03495 [Spirochaetes bacterium GWF1_41_5]|nr:MAG: hypothetical protein A2096_03495 [Spirochaetes bacterium GWF1_41_5]